MNASDRFQQGRTPGPDGRSYPFRLLTPPSGPDRPSRGWPLVIYLHGSGERGDDNHAQLRHFPERVARVGDALPCFVLAVQCPAGERWTAFDWSTTEPQRMAERPEPALAAVIAAIDQVLAAHPIDPERVALTGVSMGGFGAWELAARHPHRFCAVAPVCGGGDPASAAALRNLPIWAWHDRDDPVVAVELTRRMVEAAKAAGADVRYDEVTGLGHASWDAAYEPDKTPAWLLLPRH